MEAESRLRVEEMIVLVDVEEMLIVEICRLVIDKLVVVAIGLVTDVAVLHVGKHIPLRRDVVECLHEGIAIKFLRIGIVVAILAYFFEVFIDNCFARMKWQFAFKSAWIVAVVLGMINIFVLYVCF